MVKLTDSQATELVADLTAKLERRWRDTVHKTRFMEELKAGKLQTPDFRH